ncbi:hypothetical protein [Mycolicibacterium goodii]|uniref:hypothetical protein n=1 Tax=Mycolicibacterium goodii TaxID=134601 RepID=UPI00256F3661|nr:hypothetical protein [Mycolicibacterium goodii]
MCATDDDGVHAGGIEGHRGERGHGDAVDVLGRGDGFEHCAFVGMGWHRVLDEDAVDRVVG